MPELVDTGISVPKYFVVPNNPGPDCGDGCRRKNKGHQCLSPPRPRIADQNVARENRQLERGRRQDQRTEQDARPRYVRTGKVSACQKVNEPSKSAMHKVCGYSVEAV